MNEYRLDKQRVRRSFDRAAARYDEAAVLQREVADRMLERMELIRLRPERILDIGAGTGYCTQALRERYRKAEIVSADLSEQMVRRAASRGSLWQRWRRRQRFLVADMERLPLADASLDLVFSNLTLQWCSEPAPVFAELRRVLRPGGLLMFSTFGPDTLMELRQSWRAVDSHTHVSAFPEMHHLGDLLLAEGLADPVVDTERFTLTYREVKGLMRDLKTLGAHNATAGRPRGLTGRGRFSRMVDAYEQHRQGGVLPATYEVIYGHAWRPEEEPEPEGGPVHTVSLERLRSTLRRGMQ